MSDPVSPGLDLVDPAARARVTTRLGTLYAGHRVLLGPGTLAAWSGWVARLHGLGCRVLVVSTGRGSGPVTEPDEIVEVDAPAAVRLSDEVRRHDRLVRSLPASARAVIDRFDPEGVALWRTGPFVTSDRPIDGRRVTGGRPAAYLALEDKTRAEEVWTGAGVAHAPYAIVDAGDAAALAAATERLAGPLGAVWSGGGVAGAGDLVRWVRDPADRVGARAFLVQHCSRVRVLPFLDGVPCSIHGLVLPDGTATFRPVEIAVLRDPATRTFHHGGLSSWWDPPETDRAAMRDVARRVGDHLAERVGYRGAFGVDGVLTADGFRPTELNTRFSAGLSLLGAVDPDLLPLVHTHLVAGLDPGLRVDELETLLPLLDTHRRSRSPHAESPALAPRDRLGVALAVALARDRPDLEPAPDLRTA